MLIGYDAVNTMRDNGALGNYGRDLIGRLAQAHVKDFRALLFSTRIKEDYRRHFSGDSNVSTYVPTGSAKLLPEAWMRYHLNSLLRDEKVKIFHGLNEELPYHIGREIKTVVTCYSTTSHHATSLPDMLVWKARKHYAFSAADAVVAVSESVKEELLSLGVDERKVVVIGQEGNPYGVDDTVAAQYYELYQRLCPKD